MTNNMKALPLELFKSSSNILQLWALTTNYAQKTQIADQKLLLLFEYNIPTNVNCLNKDFFLWEYLFLKWETKLCDLTRTQILI